MIQKTHLTITLVLAFAVAALSYTFIVKGNAYLGEDGRTTIVLTEAEKAQVLGEMRAMLEGVQSITAALSINDMDAAATAASSFTAEAGQKFWENAPWPASYITRDDWPTPGITSAM